MGTQRQMPEGIPECRDRQVGRDGVTLIDIEQYLVDPPTDAECLHQCTNSCEERCIIKYIFVETPPLTVLR